MAEDQAKKNSGAGLRGQSAGETRISTVGAAGNNLRYRGFNVQDLAAWRKRMGFKTYIATTSETGSSASSTPLPVMVAALST